MDKVKESLQANLAAAMTNYERQVNILSQKIDLVQKLAALQEELAHAKAEEAVLYRQGFEIVQTISDSV